MVIADPAAELLSLVRELGDPAPARALPSQQRAAALIRRRFGLALPPPFAMPPSATDPIRPATASDAAAIASVKWRVFGTNYREGVLSDAFLDRREVYPPTSFWIGRAMVPPSRRHRLLVWGRPGTVSGYADCGPVHPDDTTDGWPEAGEVYELYVDPSTQGKGGGSLLLEAAEAWLRDAGYTRLELTVLGTNHSAQAFYRARGWTPTGKVTHVDLASAAFDEVRYARGDGMDCP